MIVQNLTFAAIPSGFVSWYDYLNAPNACQSANQDKYEQFLKLYRNKIDELAAVKTTADSFVEIVSYGLPLAVQKTRPYYGKFLFRILDLNTGIKKIVPFKNFKRFGLNKDTGTCIYKNVLSYLRDRLVVERLSNEAQKNYWLNVEKLRQEYSAYFPKPLLPEVIERYKLYLKSRHWFEKKNAVKKRDGFACRICHQKSRQPGQLHVHHLTYDRWGSESLDDLVTLCVPCHKMLHGRLGI